jgi:NADPH-dependent glutamate synthase beta subunit-like oxidoreductase/ferredoxin
VVVVPESILNQAEALLGFRKSDDAIDIVRSPEAPSDPRACALLARAYYQRGDTRGDMYSSHFFARRAMELGVSDPRIVAIRAIAAFRKERYQEAAECFARYVTEETGPASHGMLGLSLVRSGKPREGLEWLARALRAEPRSEEFAQARREAEAAIAGKAPPERPGWTCAPHGLGGPLDRRPEGIPTPYASNALSMLRGQARAPRDFHWLEENIPCQKACPAGTDIPGYLAAIYRGEYDEAYKINLHDNVFPAVLGRVCARPCESACRHGWAGLGEPVAICFSKRSAADFKTQGLVVLDPWFPPSGKRVAVVGSGVAGLAAARNLALMGHRVTVYEKHREPGGMLNQGIPEFRLPRDVIDREIEQIRRQGVEIVCNTAIGRDLPLEKLLDGNDAVVLAAGTIRPNVLNIPGRELQGIRHGLDFLLEANTERAAHVGEDIVIIGGGFTAMDCARTAKRLGAHTVELELETTSSGEPQVLKLKGESIKVLYRRSQAEMLITPGELEELQHEGIPMHFMVAPVAYIGEGGHVKAMRFVRTELGEPDAGGRRKPIVIPGSEFEIPTTTVLLATGQFPETSWIHGGLAGELVGDDGWLKSGRGQKTAQPKVFVAGDFATGARSLIDAIAHAKDCAREVDEFLMGERRIEDVAVVEDAVATGRIREMDYVGRQPMPAIDLAERTLDAEVEAGFTRELAVDETQRCYLCHYKYEIDPDVCIYCDWCIKAKPRPDCIVKISSLIYDERDRIVGFQRAASTEATKLIWINQADCIRCNACVEACPVDAISVQKVSLRTIRKEDAAETVSLPSRSV